MYQFELTGTGDTRLAHDRNQTDVDQRSPIRPRNEYH